MSANVIKAPWAPPLKLSARRPLHGARRWDDAIRFMWKDRTKRHGFIGERLRILRIVLGYSEAGMAEEIGISVQTYRKWETGGAVRKFDALIDFLVERKISLNWIIEGDASGVHAELSSGNIIILPVDTPYARERRENRLADDVRDVFKELPKNKKIAVINFLRLVRTPSPEPPRGAA
jgi:transcriptional regulator with XRE-family HTH domain